MDVGWIGLEVVIERNYRKLDLVLVDEVTDDVELHTAIVRDDRGCVGRAVGLDCFGGYFGHEVAFVRVREEFVGWDGLGWILEGEEGKKSCS